MTYHGITRDTYVRQVVVTLWDNLPQVIRGALLFNLLCLPALGLWTLGLTLPAMTVMVITVGPAWGALMQYEMHLLQGRTTGIPSFLQAFRHYWLRCALFSLLCLVPLLALQVALPLLQSESPVPPAVWIGLGADFLGIAVVATLSLYLFPYLVQRDVGFFACLRDALILASRYPIHSVGLLALGVLFGFCAAYLSLALLLFLPAVYGLFIAANCLLVLDMEAVR